MNQQLLDPGPPFPPIPRLSSARAHIRAHKGDGDWEVHHQVDAESWENYPKNSLFLLISLLCELEYFTLVNEVDVFLDNFRVHPYLISCSTIPLIPLLHHFFLPLVYQ